MAFLNMLKYCHNEKTLFVFKICFICKMFLRDFEIVISQSAAFYSFTNCPQVYIHKAVMEKQEEAFRISRV